MGDTDWRYGGGGVGPSALLPSSADGGLLLNFYHLNSDIPIRTHSCMYPQSTLDSNVEIYVMY